jgi:hypothetical protein
MVSACIKSLGDVEHTLLVQNEDIATVQVNGVGGTEAGHCEVRSAEMPKETRGKHLTSTADHNDLRCCHIE